MSRQSYEFTSESVSEGHPDKVSDRISDEIVDLFFRESIADGMSPWDVRVAAETLTTTNKVVIAGETRGTDKITKDMIEERARAAIKDIGYEQEGFHWKHADVDVLLHAQSVDIAQGVDSGTGLHTEEGAGDQGIMFGYASSDVPDFLMPAPVHYSHKILERLARARKHEGVTQLGPDSKSQVTVRYHNGRPVEATAIVLSTQHLLMRPAISRKTLSRQESRPGWKFKCPTPSVSPRRHQSMSMWMTITLSRELRSRKLFVKSWTSRRAVFASILISTNRSMRQALPMVTSAAFQAKMASFLGRRPTSLMKLRRSFE